MPKSKLESIRKLYAAQEQTLAQELERLKRERARHGEQLRALVEWLAQYRIEHAGKVSLTAEQAVRFQRFQQHMVETVKTQDAHAERLAAAERTQRDAWSDAHRQRVGIERVLDKQKAEQRDQSRRRERRGTGRAGPADWSTLKQDPGTD